MQKRSAGLIVLTVFFVIAAAGCASAPRYPTEQEWQQNKLNKFLYKDRKIFEIQGNFDTIAQFLEAAAKLKEGYTRDQVRELGFDPELEKQA